MGESRRFRFARAAAAAALVIGAAAGLTSCARLGLHAAATEPTAAAQDASEPIPTAPMVASPDPVASATPTPTATADDGRAAVVPFVTSAVVTGSGVEVGAIVPGVVEDGGRCTATATDGSVTRTVSADAVAASSYTGCMPLVVPGAGAGWQVRVQYASDTATGISPVRTVTAG